MAAPIQIDVDLGFVEKTDEWKLSSGLFPSKVGGKPAWLSLESIPSADDVKCQNCGKPCVFLCQIYAPIENPVPEQVDCFHRTVFLFVCSDPKCSVRNDNSNLVAVRSQLPRRNNYFSYDPPIESKAEKAEYKTAKDFQDLCVVCGCLGNKKCAQCGQVCYCSKEHQSVDWKKGHKKLCGKEDGNPVKNHGVMFPEYELLIEDEEEYEEQEEKSEAEKMSDFSRVVGSGLVSDVGNEPGAVKDLEKMALTDDEVDEQFEEFRKRIAQEPEQVLRYNKGGTPLWISSQDKLGKKSVPQCQYCNGPRQFEFQILPQMLTHLDVDSLQDSLDWGTLVVYTCSRSCSKGPVYKQEFVYKQDISLKDNIKGKI
ncbi:unnamed protein product [Owenia fusiformis]|uniref:MYND-type domain-containing protein n=1 Tax=Owenia fusiformis TaxID=6347 RepID=A0A8S4PH31_OWEFU|nr:unnamed protein product [Owenia fusiformis]